MNALTQIKADNGEHRTAEELAEQQRRHQKDWKEGFSAWMQRHTNRITLEQALKIDAIWT